MEKAKVQGHALPIFRALRPSDRLPARESDVPSATTPAKSPRGTDKGRGKPTLREIQKFKLFELNELSSPVYHGPWRL